MSSTNIPNLFIDKIMRLITPHQMAVMSVIYRLTIGSKKEKAAITIDTFQEYTNMSRQGVLNAIKELEENRHKLINVVRPGNRKTNIYEPINLY